MTIDGEKVLLRNADSLVKRHHPRARCSRVSGNAFRSAYYLVHLEGGRAGEMWSGSGKTAAAAWREAAEGVSAVHP